MDTNFKNKQDSRFRNTLKEIIHEQINLTVAGESYGAEGGDYSSYSESDEDDDEDSSGSEEEEEDEPPQPQPQPGKSA